MNKIYYFGEKDLAAMKIVAKSVDFGVSLEVVSAFNESRSALFMLQQDKSLFRHGVKHLATEISRAITNQEQIIKSTMQHKGFFFEYSDAVIDVCYEDMTLFRSSLKKVLEAEGVLKAELFSYVETARVMCELSVMHYDTIMSDFRSKGYRDYTKDFLEYRIGGISQKWEKMTDLLFKGWDINLNTDETKEYFNRLGEGFSKGKYIEPCIKLACEKYPEFKNT